MKLRHKTQRCPSRLPMHMPRRVPATSRRGTWKRDAGFIPYDPTRRWAPTSAVAVASSTVAASGANAAATYSMSIAKPSGTANLELLVLWVHTVGYGFASTITPPAGFTAFNAGITNSTISSLFCTAIGYWKYAGASEPSNYTVGFSNTLYAYINDATLCRVTGAAASSPINANNAGTATTTGAVGNFLSVTPSVAGCGIMLFGALTDTSSSVPSGTQFNNVMPTGNTLFGADEDGDIFWACGIKTQATAGAVGTQTVPTYTMSTGDDIFLGATVAIAPASGGGITGSVALLEVRDTIAAAGTILISGSGAMAEAKDALTASGAVRVTGTAALAETRDSLAASGTVSTVISGSVALTELRDALSGSGHVLVSGEGALSEARDGLAGSGAVLVRAAAALVETQDRLAAAGTVTLPAITGSVALQELPDALKGQGTTGAQQRGGHYAPITQAQLRELRARAKRERETQAGLEEAKRLDAASLSKQIRDAVTGKSEATQEVVAELDDPAINYDESDVEFLLLYG